MKIGQRVNYYGELGRVEAILDARQPVLARVILIPEGQRVVAVIADQSALGAGLMTADPKAYDLNAIADELSDRTSESDASYLDGDADGTFDRYDEPSFP